MQDVSRAVHHHRSAPIAHVALFASRLNLIQHARRDASHSFVRAHVQQRAFHARFLKVQQKAERRLVTFSQRRPTRNLIMRKRRVLSAQIALDGLIQRVSES